MRFFALLGLLCLVFCQSAAQQRTFTRAFPGGHLYLSKELQDHPDSLKRMVRNKLGKHECLAISEWVTDETFWSPTELYIQYIVNQNFDTILAPFIYDQIYPVSDRTYIAEINGRMNEHNLQALLDLNQKILLPFSTGVIGRMDLQLSGRNPPTYTTLLRFQNGRTKRYGIFDLKSETITVPAIYQSLELLNDKFLVGMSNDLYGIIDRHNRTVVPFQYQQLGTFGSLCSIDEIPAQDSSFRYGVINGKNEIVIPFQYQNISHFKPGWVRYAKTENGKNSHGFIELRTKKSYAISDVKIGIPAAPSVLKDHFETLIKPRWMYTYHSKYRYVKYCLVIEQKRNWRNPDDPGDLIDSQYFKCDTLNGQIPVLKGSKSGPISAINSVYINTYDSLPLDSLGADSFLGPEDMLGIAVEQFRHSFDFFPWILLPNISASYGFLIDNDGSVKQVLNQQSEATKAKLLLNTILPMMADSNLRKQTIAWCKPAFREAFEQMPFFYKDAYRSTARYLRNYLLNYDEKTISHFLETHNSVFSKNNPYTNQPDDRRKLTAFIDRLILVHQFISVEQAKSIFIPICDELLSWK